MKTTKILSAITLVLILAANSLFAGRTTIGDPVSSLQQNLVTYDVKINASPNFPGYNEPFLVAITDETGRRVAPAQLFHKGVLSYTFKEAGSFRGTRIAVMVPYPSTPSGWVIPPSVLKANFIAGKTYHFELTPQTNEQTRKNDL